MKTKIRERKNDKTISGHITINNNGNINSTLGLFRNWGCKIYLRERTFDFKKS